MSYIYIVGLGPGSEALRTSEAKEALRVSSIIVGYSTYLELLTPEETAGKTLYSTPMKQEIERVEFAIGMALEGHAVAIVSSGDSVIYALAGLVFELLETMGALALPVQVVPGISALSSASALLGAPLTSDFAVISLSDLLTPKEHIIQRASASLEADFALVLYNPRSKKRTALLTEIITIAKKYRNTNTPLGIVTNAYRKNQEIIRTTLGEVDENAVSMFSTIVIGNSTTRYIAEYMVTPRGYLQKYHNKLPL